jgi:GNAT superfamily N-acetyltransferase
VQIQTSIGMLQMLLAERKDKQAVLAIVRDAALWLRAKGIDQWQGTLKDGFETRVEQHIGTGNIFLARLERDPVATVRIEWEDPVFWGPRGDDGLAGYVHGLAIARKWTGRRVGEDVLSWARQLIEARGKAVRLDCVADNPRLCQYYEALGFSYQGDSVPSQHSKTRLYEFTGKR